MKIEVNHVTICSVDSVEHRKWKIMTAPTDQEPNMTKRRTEFILPAADKKDGYAICRVYDGVAFPALYDLGSSADRPGTQPKPINAYDTAQHLVSEWQEKSLKVKAPRGIMIIKGDTPTDEELSILNGMATARMRALVQMVDLAVNAGNNLDFVTKEHLDAANALGEVREWARADRRQKKVCPRCQGIIEAAALGCTHCGIDLGEFYDSEGYTAQEIQALDPAVYEATIAKKARMTRRANAVKG